MSSRRSKSHAARNVLFQTAYYYSVFLGVTSLSYDPKRKQLLQPIYLRVYSFVVNVLIVGAIPFSFKSGFKSMDVFGSNKLIRYIHLVSLVIGLVHLVLSVVLRWPRERHLMAIGRELIAMECNYLAGNHVSQDIDDRFDRLFFAKCGTAVFQSIGLAFVIVIMAYDQMTFAYVLIALVYVNSMNIPHCVMFHYFCALWQMSRAYAILNDRLLVILQQVRHMQTFHDILPGDGLTMQTMGQMHAIEVRTIRRLHHRLVDLIVVLNNSYKRQMPLVILVNLLYHVISGHYTYFVYGGREPEFHFSPAIITFGIICDVLMLLDYYLVFLLCDTAVTEYENTTDILRNLLEIPHMEVLLKKSCDLFSMQLMLWKLRINIGGMFNLNKNTFFLLMCETVQQTFILVLFDYENRDKIN